MHKIRHKTDMNTKKGILSMGPVSNSSNSFSMWEDREGNVNPVGIQYDNT